MILKIPCCKKSTILKWKYIKSFLVIKRQVITVKSRNRKKKRKKAETNREIGCHLKNIGRKKRNRENNMKIKITKIIKKISKAKIRQRVQITKLLKELVE